ncbi:RagB/SusD family nutrient uptake outer membrane protein [Mucilaginibacter sp. AW1-3]
MKKKIILSMCVGLLTCYSCQKSLLSPPLTTAISNVDYQQMNTVARIQAGVLGLYATVRSGASFGGRYIEDDEAKGENWINATSNGITGANTWKEANTNGDTEVLGLWAQCYLSINDCNLFIDGMVASGNAVLGNATLSANYIAEARFLRAINYFALLNMYCQPYAVSNGGSAGLPLRLTGNSKAGDYSLAPVTVAKVYDQIIADLTFAEANLPIAYYTTGTTLDPTSNTTRASRNSAIALSTRVYLAKGDYATVITQANKIVSATAPFTAATGVPYALQPTIANVFKTPYTTTESIFSVPFTSAETPGTQNQLATYFVLTTGEFYINPTSQLFTDPNWKTTDARRGLTKVSGTKTYSNKYPTGSPYTDWAPVMRYSEVLLNLAEARANINGPTDLQAIALLNAVRQRSDATTTFTTATMSNILEERNIEFLGEGKRWLDLWRLHLEIPAKGATIPILAPTAGAYIWPMSGNEQVYNSLIGR